MVTSFTGGWVEGVFGHGSGVFASELVALAIRCREVAMLSGIEHFLPSNHRCVTS